MVNGLNIQIRIVIVLIYYFFMSHSFFEEVHIDRQLVHSRPRWNKETILFLKNSLRPLVPLSFFTLYNCKKYNTPTISQRKPILAKKQEKRLQNQRWVEKFYCIKKHVLHVPNRGHTYEPSPYRRL